MRDSSSQTICTGLNIILSKFNNYFYQSHNSSFFDNYNFSSTGIANKFITKVEKGNWTITQTLIRYAKNTEGFNQAIDELDTEIWSKLVIKPHWSWLWW